MTEDLTIFLASFLWLVIVPGGLWTWILGVRRHYFLFCIALGYGSFLINSIVFRYAEIDVAKFDVWLSLLNIILVISTIALIRKRSKKSTLTKKNITQTWLEAAYRNKTKILGLVIVVITSLTYYQWAGPYDEVPSDVLKHLEHSQTSYAQILSGKLRLSGYQTSALMKGGRHWQQMYAFLAWKSNLTIEQSLFPATVWFGLVFLIGVYLFSWTIFDKAGRKNSSAVLLTSLLSCFLLAFVFGVGYFSFFRYYSIGPTINMILLYFLSILLFKDWIDKAEKSRTGLIFIVMITLVAGAYHTQEAIFIAVILSSMLLVEYIVTVENYRVGTIGGQGSKLGQAVLNVYRDNRQLSLLFAGFTVLVAAIVLALLFFFERGNPGSPKLIPLGSIVPIFQDLYILNPSYQFYQVITGWGIVVYILFFLNAKKLVSNQFLFAGMLSPLLTVFNPIFTEVFLRFQDYSTLWRLSLVVPITFVGAALIRLYTENVIKKRYFGDTRSIFALFLLILFLFPFNVGFVKNEYTKLYMLDQVKLENSPRYWQDMMNYLRETEGRKKIATDAVTGYMITAFTQHNSPRFKFFEPKYLDFKKKAYEKKDFRHLQKWLLVMNLRNGTASRQGRLGRHWPENILFVSERYSQEFIDFVNDEKKLFSKKWENNGIYVFEIRKLSS